VQAAAPPVVVALPAIPADFSLARLRPDKPFELPRILIDCPEPAPGEIVVCGFGTGPLYGLQPLPPAPADPTAMAKAGQFMTLHLGPIEIGPGCSPDCAGISLRIRF
jgi:hypothetical protein